MRNPFRILVITLLGMLLLVVLKSAEIHGDTLCNLGCVTTRDYDNSRNNVNANETILKASTLSSLNHTVSRDLHGAVFTQPLYVSNLVTGQGNRNVVFVATEEGWVYALDGDNIHKPAIWQTNLNNSDETAIPDASLPGGCKSIAPEVGITGTPAIDLTRNVLYVVSSHYNTSSKAITQRFNALNLGDGTSAAAPLDIAAAFQGIGMAFDPSVQNQHAGLALASGPGGIPLIYAAWSGYCDGLAYTGKVAAFTFSAGTLSLRAGFEDETGVPDPGPKGGIWMSGVAPAVSPTVSETPAGSGSSEVFVSTGNGDFVPGTGYGQSVVRLRTDAGKSLIHVTGSYTISAWDLLNKGSDGQCTKVLHMPPPYPPNTTVCSPGDFEVGSGGVIVARPTGTGNVPPGDNFVVLAGGKEGVFYVLDPSNMKHSGADTQDPCGAFAIQCLGAVQLPLPCCTGQSQPYGNRGGAAFWPGSFKFQENVLYVAGSQDSKIRAYQMIPGGGGTFNTALFGSAPPPNPDKNGLLPYPGASPVITWNSKGGQPKDAILWILDTSADARVQLFGYQAVPNQAGGDFPLVWSDTTNGPKPSRFMVPTVINGHVYVGGRKPSSKSCITGSCVGQVVSWQ